MDGKMPFCRSLFEVVRTMSVVPLAAGTFQGYVTYMIAVKAVEYT